MSEIDELRAALATLTARVKLLEDHLEIPQYGPPVDIGSAETTASLWTKDGTFDAVGAITMRGHEEIAAMVTSAGRLGRSSTTGTRGSVAGYPPVVLVRRRAIAGNLCGCRLRGSALGCGSLLSRGTVACERHGSGVSL
jgi:hypothetical protein